jgi:hypothetical protein
MFSTIFKVFQMAKAIQWLRGTRPYAWFRNWYYDRPAEVRALVIVVVLAALLAVFFS